MVPASDQDVFRLLPCGGLSGRSKWEDPWVHQKLAGVIINLIWPGGSLESLRRNWKTVAGERDVWAHLLRLLSQRPGLRYMKLSVSS